jgi:hypothetical protein
MSRRPLAERVSEAAQASLAAHDYVSPIEVLMRLGWLDPGAVTRWQQGREECLEPLIQASPLRQSEAMDLLQRWATERGLPASEAPQVARTPQRQTLSFSREGKPAVEAFWRTRWLSAVISDKKREQLVAKAKRGPDLLVIVPRNTDWKCHGCGGTGDLLIMEPPGPACLDCAGLGDLEFLSAGDALLTRRAKQKSSRSAVVVRWSRTRKRYERQGLMVEPKVLAQVQRDLEERRQQ